MSLSVQPSAPPPATCVTVRIACLADRAAHGPAQLRPKVLSERLGHATVSFTLDAYSHAIPAMQEAVALIAGLVFAK